MRYTKLCGEQTRSTRAPELGLTHVRLIGLRLPYIPTIVITIIIIIIIIIS